MSAPGIAELEEAPRVERLGLHLPARFADLDAECRTLREGAALYDARLRRWLRMTGEDRVQFLQGMITNDVKALAPGAGMHAALLTQQGRVVTDLRVHAAGDHLLLDLPAQSAAAARAALEKFIVADDVELEDEDLVLLGLEGPAAAATLAAVAAGAALDRLAEVEIGGAPVRLVPGGVAGESGVVLGVAVAAAAAVWQALRAAGARPVGIEALDMLRVEAGIPWTGADMNEDVLVVEAELEDAISFRKGCYLGQEVVERVAARGHVNRKRTGLVFAGEPPPPGTALFAGEREVGRVTSSVRSPLLGEAIGMGYVRREHWEPGTELALAGGGTARVAALPFRRPGA